MTKKFNLADEVDPGAERVWAITHQPKNQTKPVRLELREYIVERTSTTPASMTKLLGFVNTIADRKVLAEDAALLLARVGRVDEFVGVHERGA